LNFKGLLALIGVMLFGAGMVMAISGATPTLVSQTRWAGDSAASVSTQGGNISVVNVTGTVLTSKWAEYSGNVSGRITLDDDGAGVAVYNWTWTPATGGAICTSTAPAYAFSTATTATAAQLDTEWGFTGTDADSAANTYTSTCGSALDFAQASVAGTTAAAAVQGSSTFMSCAVNDGSTGSKDDFGFCTQLQPAGSNYRGQTVNYELMVPTDNAPASSETYYFYLELN
jgi:hypothetical protein